MTVIQIIYKDGTLGFVDSLELTRLIDAGKITKFLRNNSWAYPGVDPIRAEDSNPMAWRRRATDPLFLEC